jgi:hypothetical protein
MSEGLTYNNEEKTAVRIADVVMAPGGPRKAPRYGIVPLGPS